MAKGTITRGHGAYGKDEQTRKNEDKLSKKLQADLESALLRLFENSVYCDVELIVESDSILTHSCILQARVARFYNFLVTECQVLRKNGFSSIAICNVSFISLRKFVENVYRNIELSEVEEYMLKLLLEKKNTADLCEITKGCRGPDSLLKAPKSHIELTPEADLFYTPKCSPSEIQKSFVQSRSDSPVKIKDNDITCYYKIVSVDDIHIDEKGERVVDKSRNNNNSNTNNGDECSLNGDEHLEKELAEQDELFLSFKSIFSKVSKAKPCANPVSNAAGHSRAAKRKEAPKPAKRLQSNLLSVDDCKKAKAKLPLWRPNPLARDVAENHFDKHLSPKTNYRNNSADPFSPRKRLALDSAAVSHEIRNCHTDMDMSATGADSGLETSSSCQPEASPRENTASETSGVDLTDAAVNEDIPHDEETVSTKAAESMDDSSSSSDVGTWDANDESRNRDHGGGFTSSIVERDDSDKSREASEEKEGNSGFCRESLDEEEIARLDAMERNIRECETFLDRERQMFYCCDNDSSSIEARERRVFESNAEADSKNPTALSEDTGRIECDNNNVTEREGNYLYNEEDVCNNRATFDSKDPESDDVTCRNLINNEIERDDNVVIECNANEFYESKEGLAKTPFGYLSRQERDPGGFNASTNDLFHVKTPPCSPRHACGSAEETREKSDPDPQIANNAPPMVSNYFIDASSLLDEDEIVSQPVSLVSFKTVDLDQEQRKEEEPFEMGEEELSPRDNIQFIQDEERRQGELLFKNSIPHFSRHEVEETEEAMERSMRGDDDNRDRDVGCVADEGEQVVPSSGMNLGCSVDEGDIHVAKSYSAFSLPNAVPSEREEMMIDVELFDFAEGDSKKVDAESLPIVSGGVMPEDFSSGPPSQTCSPHMRRRNESAPIISGGMDYVEEERKAVRKANANPQGEAWIVSFDDEKPRRRRQTITSESDMESLEPSCDSQNGDKTPSSAGDGGLREVRLDNCQVANTRNLNNAKDVCGSQRSSNSIEKSASLGYFIEFGKGEEENVEAGTTEPEKEKSGAKENAKKNIFSMFIDMKDESRSTDSIPSFERQGTWDQDAAESREDAVKKPFYMFIESDSPATKRKTNQTPPQKKLLKSSDGTAEERQVASERKNSDAAKRSTGNERSSPAASSSFKGSSPSLFEASSRREEGGQEPKAAPQVRTSKLPLPLSKSSSLSSVNGDVKMVLWSESRDRRGESANSGETWLKTNDVQITYKGRKGEISENGEEAATLRKGSTFVIADESTGGCRKSDGARRSSGGFHLRTVEEVRSPFKSPEERDSGVIVTEESDDSFVKLSDMDNYKNPYLESGKRKPSGSGVMSRSIPESKWTGAESGAKAAAKSTDGDMMSKSIGSGAMRSGFATDKQVSRSLSRLFPNLNLSAIQGRRSNNTAVSPGGKQETDQTSDPQASEMSELSSMQSSADPSGLEMSTSETDTSCHNGGTSRLGEDLLRMFLEEISTDVVVEVGGRRMKAHKCILSSRCQYFAAMLSGGWVESAGNVISLQGFSYNSVHFALCHIYSGENRIPDSLNIIELATLADMLCLEGLKEVISHTLKVKYCHCFHLPCDECHVGVLDCLPVAAAYGLDDLYRKCLRWITKHFVRVWPSKTFASLPKELLDKCYQHHVVHMTVENVLDTILNIDKVRGSLPNVRWSETVSRLVTKLHDSAVKYIADHFSSILTSDNFLALGKEASWSVGRLEDSLLEATKRLPPEQACWSHARLHRILTVAKGPDPPSEMDWNGNFIDLLQCISGHVENSLIKQAPRAAKSKAWRQLEPELRSRIQERACLVLPDDALSPKVKRTSSAKVIPRDSRPSSLSATARANSRTMEIRHMKIAMTQQVTRNASMGRIPHADSRSVAKEPRSSRTITNTSVARKPEPAKKTATGAPEVRKVSSSSRFMDVKPRYLEPKSPQKALSDKPSGVSNFRRTIKPLSSSDSSRNCSPLNANVHGKVGVLASSRQHRDSIVSTESTASYDGKKDRSYASARSEPSSAKTLSRLNADENMSTDSLLTDSLYSEKEATTRASDESKLVKGKENVRKSGAKPIVNSGTLAKSNSNSPSTRKLISENSTSTSYRSNTASKKLTASASETKVTPPKRFSAARITNVNQRASPGRSSLASPRNSTNRNMLQGNATKYDANVINGNTVKKNKDVDMENNKNSVKDDKRPSTVSRSGTFLKDEPTILKKPQAENIESSF